MVAPSEQLNLEIVAHDQSGNPREAIWNVQDEDVPMEVIVESHMTYLHGILTWKLAFFQHIDTGFRYP